MCGGAVMSGVVRKCDGEKEGGSGSLRTGWRDIRQSRKEYYKK